MQYWQHPNYSVLGGRITNDLQIKDVKTPNALLEFSVANNMKSTYVSDTGAKTPDKVHFFRCRAWGKLAEILASQFKKGDAIVLSGYWVWHSWVAQDGTKREAQTLLIQGFHHQYGTSGGQSRNSEIENDVDTSNTTSTTPVVPIPPVGPVVLINNFEDNDIPF